MCVVLVEVCWFCFCVLALELHVGLGDACWPCLCVWILLMRAGLVTCWLIYFHGGLVV